MKLELAFTSFSGAEGSRRSMISIHEIMDLDRWSTYTQDESHMAQQVTGDYHLLVNKALAKMEMLRDTWKRHENWRFLPLIQVTFSKPSFSMRSPPKPFLKPKDQKIDRFCTSTAALPSPSFASLAF